MPTISYRTATLAALVLGICALALLTACDRSPEPYHIGVAFPTSGPIADDAAELIHGVELYVDEINEAGGIDGRPLEIVLLDDENTPEGAAEAAREFADDDRILGVVGHFYSSTALGATDVYDEAGLVNVVPVANAPDVTRESPWVFGMIPPTDMEGRFMAYYLSEVLDVSRVVGITETDAYGDGLATSFVDEAEELGIEVVDINRFDPAEPLPETLASDVVDALHRSPPSTDDDSPRNEGNLATHEGPELEDDAEPEDDDPEPGDDDPAEEALDDDNTPDPPEERDPDPHSDGDAVLLLSQVGVGKEIVAELRHAGLEAPLLVPGAFVEDPDLPEFYRDFDGDLFAVSPFLYETGNQQATHFFNRYVERHGTEPGTGSPMSYDATRVLATAIAEAGPEREAIREYVADLRDDRAIDSVSGTLSMDDHGAVDRALYVTRVEDGHFKVAFTQLMPNEQDDFHHVDVAYVGFDQFRIEAIDPIEFRYVMESFLWVKWQHDDLDTDDLVFINGINRVDNERYVLQEDLSGDTNYRAYRIRNHYLTPFDLRQFPYDEQVLKLQIGHRTKDSNELMLVADVGYYIEEPTELFDPEWRYLDQHTYSELYRYPSGLGEIPATERADVPYVSSVNIDVSVSRLAFPHLLNTLLPLVLILMLTTAVLWLSRVKLSVRLGIGMTALLAILVFHMTQVASLPNVGYLTVIDLYFVIAYLAYFVLFLVLVGVYLLRENGREQAARILNRTAPAVILLILALFFAWLTLGATA